MDGGIASKERDGQTNDGEEMESSSDSEFLSGSTVSSVTNATLPSEPKSVQTIGDDTTTDSRSKEHHDRNTGSESSSGSGSSRKSSHTTLGKEDTSGVDMKYTLEAFNVSPLPSSKSHFPKIARSSRPNSSKNDISFLRGQEVHNSEIENFGKPKEWVSEGILGPIMKIKEAEEELMCSELEEAGTGPVRTLHIVSLTETEVWINEAGKANKKMHMEFAKTIGFPKINKLTKDQRQKLVIKKRFLTLVTDKYKPSTTESHWRLCSVSSTSMAPSPFSASFSVPL